MIYNQIPGIFLQEDAALRLLRVRWNGGRNMQLFRDAASRLVEFAQQNGIRRLLLDLNDQPDVPVFDQLWLSTTLLPKALRLSVRQLVIIISDTRVYNRHVLESLLTQLQHRIRCDIQYFPSADAALEWLTDHSPRVAELLAEWEQHGGDGPISGGQPSIFIPTSR